MNGSLIWMSHITHTKMRQVVIYVTHSRRMHVETWMGHLNEWGISRTQMSHVTRTMSHVTNLNKQKLGEPSVYLKPVEQTLYSAAVPIKKRHIPHANESRYTYNETRHKSERVMSHVWMKHGARMTELCHTHEWVMSHIWISHVTRMMSYVKYMNTSHIWMSRITHEKKLRYTYEWVMSYVWMKHGARMTESCHTHE